MIEAGSVLQGRYQIEKPVGRGGMALVYAAWDLQFKQRVAVKQVAVPECTPEQRAAVLAQFEQEAQVLRSLKHENIPNVYGFFHEAENTFLVMDFVEGRTLQSLVSRRADGTAERLPSQSDVLDWALQIGRALDYLHTLKPLSIVYKDLKPGNVMLTPDGKVMLLDFGLAKNMGHSGESATILKGAGTPGYAPPEQWGSDDQSADPRADLYALGATMFYLLKGATPPDPTRQPDVHAQLLSRLTSESLGLPRGVGPLLARLLAPRREDRCQTAREAVELLTQANAPEVVAPSFPALPDSTVALSTPSGSPRKRPFALVAAAVGMGGVALMAWHFGSTRPLVGGPQPPASPVVSADVPTPTPTRFMLDKMEE